MNETKNCAYCKKTIEQDLWSTFDCDYHWDCYLKVFWKIMDEFQKEHHPNHTWEEV